MDPLSITATVIAALKYQKAISSIVQDTPIGLCFLSVIDIPPNGKAQLRVFSTDSNEIEAKLKQLTTQEPEVIRVYIEHLPGSEFFLSHLGTIPDKTEALEAYGSRTTKIKKQRNTIAAVIAKLEAKPRRFRTEDHIEALISQWNVRPQWLTIRNFLPMSQKNGERNEKSFRRMLPWQARSAISALNAWYSLDDCVEIKTGLRCVPLLTRKNEVDILQNPQTISDDERKDNAENEPIDQEDTDDKVNREGEKGIGGKGEEPMIGK
jgi:hypothetical protein